MARRSRHDRSTPDRIPTPVWPEDADSLPPIDGIVAALDGFVGIGDAAPLDIEVQVSRFLGQLGAGGLADAEADAVEHEDLINGVVEVCLHHLEQDPPRVVLDFCWVLDAFGLGYVHWPLRARLAEAALPSTPAWAVPVGQAEVTGAHLVSHETGDGHDVVLTARHATADRDHVVAVYIDANLGGLAKDLLVHADGPEFLRLSAAEPGMTVSELDPSVAAATIDAAIDHTFEAGPMAPVSDEFATLYSVLEHYLAKVSSGEPLAAPAVASEAEQADVVDRFLATDDGAVHAGDREVLVRAVEFVVDELGGDSLRWTPVVAHLVIAGWAPLALEEDELGRLPDLLRTFVPWAHLERGWADRYVSDTLEVIDNVAEARREASEGGSSSGTGRVEILEQAVAAGVDLDDEEALDAFLDRYLEDGE